MILTYNKYHANDYEDKFIFENFRLPDKGVFVDVGAGPDGIQGSNTYFFERNGWTGLAIDGDKRNAEQLKSNRKNGISAVVSNKDKVKFYNGAEPDISGILPTDQNKGNFTEIEPVKLEKLLVKHKIGKIDLLSIDTEGSETDVWESFDVEKHRPTILVIEFITQGVMNTSLFDYFTKQGYVFMARVGANLIFHDKHNK